MEQEIPEVAEETPDPVTETLERLEVADTLEDLRRHIDELIARLAEDATIADTAATSVSPDLEGQIENLGDKVESASCLLAELADLLEAQTERIETIEQQLGDPDLGAPSGGASGLGMTEEAAGIPRFSMRPPQTLPEQQSAQTPSAVETVGAAEAVDAVRGYLEKRFDRLESAIQQVEHRISDLRTGAEQRERQVRELEERLLILVEAAPARRGRVERFGHAAATTTAAREGRERAGLERRAADTLASADVLEPRPTHMPLFAHEAAGVRRALVRRLRAAAPPPVALFRAAASALDPGFGSPREEEERPAPAASSPARAQRGEPLVSSYFANGRTHAVKSDRSAQSFPPLREAAPSRTAASAHSARATADAEAVARAERVRRTNQARSTGAARDTSSTNALGVHRRTGETPSKSGSAGIRQGETPSPKSVRDLEQLVERDVKLRREFGTGTSDQVRLSKARPTVLVVDDAPDALTVLSIYLSKTGYNVVTATSAEDCLAKLKHHAIDAIVLDARLPGASGEHVCRVLREDPSFTHRRDVAVIVYTGYPEEFPPEVCDRWQADEYVIKGGDMLPLMRALVRHTTDDRKARVV